MAEYIERGAFIKILKKTKNDCKHYPNKVVCDFAIQFANLMTPADVQEVRHGKWIKSKNERKCSLCGYFYFTNTKGLNYCPNCGVKMDKE